MRIVTIDGLALRLEFEPKTRVLVITVPKYNCVKIREVGNQEIYRCWHLGHRFMLICDKFDPWCPPQHTKEITVVSHEVRVLGQEN